MVENARGMFLVADMVENSLERFLDFVQRRASKWIQIEHTVYDDRQVFQYRVLFQEGILFY